ncbi:hypothetical protein CGCSCA4_v013982 [Colletotrichum siamense]|uniref:Uncharacterized protein n=3 Tax=Colletotrichum gloeosporioides species complex TaxID=2707338 RepID=A0A9P5BP25_COLSI|nr:hypothetical protein CGCSCA4_v013982 [Colletotrichum siamense]KAF4844302.1 hypothetical protein CGCSCA2_v013912 [Colletotrichum siamense]KAK1849917.1 hypothetical protein CCHR01_07480 [Colletotrichum chrysophilum]
MHYSRLFLSLFLLVTLVVAVPLPMPLDGLFERSTNRKGDGLKNSKTTAKGIQKNIHIQKDELHEVKDVRKAEGTKNFRKEQGELKADIRAGQRQRERNQHTADPSNRKLVKGLNKVEKAQALEYKQASSLNGGRNDKKTLNKLNHEIHDGINVNKENKKAALRGNDRHGHGH